MKAFIKAGKMTICPGMGSKELELIGIRMDREWAENLSHAMKVKLGMLQIRPELTELERKKREQQRAKDRWRNRKKNETLEP